VTTSAAIQVAETDRDQARNVTARAEAAGDPAAALTSLTRAPATSPAGAPDPNLNCNQNWRYGHD
jgi:hypothetical protein